LSPKTKRRNTWMSTVIPEFRRGVIRPVDCLKEGWAAIKDQYWLFAGIVLVSMLIGSAVPMGVIMGPMMCGMYMCLLARLRGENVSFEMLFKGFDYFMESFIATLFQIIPAFLVIIPAYIGFFAVMVLAAAGPGRGTAMSPLIFFGGMSVIVLVVLLLCVAIGSMFVFSYPLIVDRKLSGFTAVKTSVKAALGNLSGVLGLLLLSMAMGIIGALCCYVGAFLIMPINFAAMAVAYRKVFPDQTAPPRYGENLYQ
jgi:hypothetical protein